MSKPISGTFPAVAPAPPRPAGLALPAPVGFNLIMYGIAVLVAAFSIAALIVLASTALVYADGYPDPFASYGALIPGQPLPVLADYWCESRRVPDRLRREICSVKRDSDGVILDMTVDQNGMIVGVRFEMPGLQIVDLVQRWGPPDAVMQDESYYGLHWEVGVVAYARADRWFSYQLRVESVTLTWGI